MTTNPTPEQLRGLLADIAGYTGKPIADVSWDDLENYLTRTRAQLDQAAAGLAHLTAQLDGRAPS